MGDGFAVAFADVSASRRAEAALRDQSELTQTIADNATAALFMMDTRGRCTFMNPAAEAMIGFSLDEIRDRPLHAVIHHHHPDGRPYPMAECPIDRALPEGFEVRAHEDVFIRRSGEFFPVVCAARPIVRGGVPVGTVVEVRDVTDEKRAERALRESEERYRSLGEATAAIVWSTPASGELADEQPGWAAFTGQRPEDYLGWGWLEAVHPDDREQTAAAWRRALEQRTIYQVEHRLRRADGEYRHMLVRGVPILDEQGEVREWVGLHSDITERKQMEEWQRFLAEAGKRLAASLDYETTLASIARLAVPALADWCAIDILGADGQVQRLEVAHTDPAKRALAFELEKRYPPDPNAPIGVPQVLRTGEPELVPEIPEALLAQAARDEEHGRIIRELGLRSYMVVPLIARGRTLGAVTLVSAESGRHFGPADLEVAQELAARAALAVDNARLLRELETERTRLQQVFTEAPAVMALYTGPDHVISLVNPTWERTVGKPNTVGKPFREVFPEFAGTGLYELLDRVYQTGEPYANPEVNVPLERWESGVLEDTYWNLVWRPLAGEGPHGREILVHAVEVTEQVLARRQVEQKAEELARVAAALERSNRELDQFAYVTSHDLKAPLRGIANLAQWIEEDLGGQVPAEVREHLALLKGRVHRMEALIEGILQYSRAGRAEGETEMVDTRALVHEIVDLLDPPEQVAIEVGELPTILTPRLPLQQVLQNLVGNAVKHLGRAEGRVRVDARAHNGGWEFSVADDGPGIAPEYHERIFGIFQTLQARDKVEGTGIGLSLVKKIVEHRGGRVWVESQEGAGATFRFTWPASDGSRRPGPATLHHRDAAGNHALESGERENHG